MGGFAKFLCVLAVLGVSVVAEHKCGYCTTDGCHETVKECDWVPTKHWKKEHYCAEYTTECGDHECSWNEECLEKEECDGDYCHKAYWCELVDEPHKCEKEKVCDDYGYCHDEEVCEDFKEEWCGHELCELGYVCEVEKKAYYKKKYVCKDVVKNVCNGDDHCGGEHCGWGYRCAYKSCGYYHDHDDGTYHDPYYYGDKDDEWKKPSDDGKRKPDNGGNKAAGYAKVENAQRGHASSGSLTVSGTDGDGKELNLALSKADARGHNNDGGLNLEAGTFTESP